MQIKVVIIYFFLVSAGVSLSAQEINYTLTTHNSKCNGLNTGQADVNVLQTNPPYTFLWNSGNTNSDVSSLAPGDYFVTITDSTGYDTVVQVTIAEIPCELAAASVFTPNNDGFNDTWRISNIEYYPENHILVYNRWGQKVFDSKGEYEEWDGRDIFGTPVADNAYFYIIYGDRKDEKSIVKGSVSIIR